MTDLVKALRKGARRPDRKPVDNNFAERDLGVAAADEIERLRSAIDRANAKLDESLFMNAEHAKARAILRDALQP